MAAPAFDKDLVKDPRVWRMTMRVGRGALHVILYSTVEDNSLIYREISLDPNASTPLKALEEAVYDNPLLLSDFDKVYCIVETSVGYPIPSPIDNNEVIEKMIQTTDPEFDGEIIVNDINCRNARIAMGVEKDMAAFLHRTFFNISIYHHLTPLCRYFLGKHNRGNSRRMYANLRQGALDLLAFDNGRMLLANTFKFSHINDTVYYILATQQSLGIDPANNEIMLAGDTVLREELTPVLRKYIGYVLPVIFPSSMFRAGKDSMRAPFDLIVLPLCE